jgi:hypothetical protein
LVGRSSALFGALSWETGRRNPTLETMFALTTVLSVPLGVVLHRAGHGVGVHGAAVDAVLLDLRYSPNRTVEVCRIAIRQRCHTSAPHASGVVETLTLTHGSAEVGTDREPSAATRRNPCLRRGLGPPLRRTRTRHRRNPRHDLPEVTRHRICCTSSDRRATGEVSAPASSSPSTAGTAAHARHPPRASPLWTANDSVRRKRMREAGTLPMSQPAGAAGFLANLCPPASWTLGLQTPTPASHSTSQDSGRIELR